MTTIREIVTDPEMEAVQYGIPVAHVGEDGSMLALGHPGTRRALAAFNRHARVFVGLVNLADDRHASYGDWHEAVDERWVIFRKPDPTSLYEDPDSVWYFDRCDEGTPGAQPVTVLDVDRL